MRKVMCVMLSLKECSTSSTGENISGLLDAELTRCGIPWNNCLCFAADTRNASVMMGKCKGVAAFLVKKAPSLYILSCACHLIHLAAGKAASALTVKVDELVVDVYYYLDKSSNRSQNFEKFQKLHNIDVHTILKHVSVRWLSIGICVSRLLEQWPALRDCFASETKHATSAASSSMCSSGRATSHSCASTSKASNSNSSGGFDFFLMNRK